MGTFICDWIGIMMAAGNGDFKSGSSSMNYSKRRIIWHGMFLFLLGLLTGLVEQKFANIRMGLAGAFGRGDEWNVSGCLGRSVGRSAIVAAVERGGVLGRALWNIRKLASDDAGGGLWNGRDVANYCRRAACGRLARTVGDGWIPERWCGDYCYIGSCVGWIAG